jgi:hypothetical protein
MFKFLKDLFSSTPPAPMGSVNDEPMAPVAIEDERRFRVLWKQRKPAPGFPGFDRVDRRLSTPAGVRHDVYYVPSK